MPVMELSWIVIALEVVWIAGMATWIALERRPAASTLAWIFALAFLPAVGIPIYLLIGPRRLERKRREYVRALAERWSAEGAPQPEVAVPHDVARQIRLGVGVGESPLLPATAYSLHHDGLSAFEAIRNAVAGATHHVHLEFYIWDADTIGSELVELLAARAREGVEVRLLVDAVGAHGTPDRFFAPLVRAGGRFARFHPTSLRYLARRFLNFRTHRKIVVVDGRIGLTGGMNVSDHQTIGKQGEPPWRDTQLLLEGPAVHGLQATFLENWQYATGACPEGDAYYPPDPRPPLVWTQVLASGPDRDAYPIHELIVSAIAAADERVWIANPYLVPDEALTVALRLAAHRGVDVRVLLPRRGDSRLVDAAMRSYYEELMSSGVRIFEYGAAFLHAKTLLVDRELALISTANLDNRSLRLNFEVGVVVHGSKMAEELAWQFVRDLTEAIEILGDRNAGLPFPTRLAEAAARLFSPIL